MNITGTPEELQRVVVLTKEEHKALLARVERTRERHERARQRYEELMGRYRHLDLFLAVMVHLFDVQDDGTHWPGAIRFTPEERDALEQSFYACLTRMEDGSLLTWWSHRLGHPDVTRVRTASDMLPWLKAALRCKSCKTNIICSKGPYRGCIPPAECAEYRPYQSGCNEEGHDATS